MREIDFRPEKYRMSRKRKRDRVIRATLLGILAVELILGSVGTRIRTAAAREDVVKLRGEFESQAEVLRGLDDLLTDMGELRSRRQLLSDVAGGAPVHSMLAELSHMMPDATVLTEVYLTQERRIGDASAVTDGGLEPAATPPSPHSKGGHKRVGRLEITGWAASDINVGSFMTNMAGSALFRNVRLNYSKPVVVKGRAVREFKLTCGFPQFE